MEEVEEFKVEKSKEEGTTIANKKSGPEELGPLSVNNALSALFYCTVIWT